MEALDVMKEGEGSDAEGYLGWFPNLTDIHWFLWLGGPTSKKTQQKSSPHWGKNKVEDLLCINKTKTQTTLNPTWLCMFSEKLPLFVGRKTLGVRTNAHSAPHPAGWKARRGWAEAWTPIAPHSPSPGSRTLLPTNSPWIINPNQARKSSWLCWFYKSSIKFSKLPHLVLKIY